MENQRLLLFIALSFVVLLMYQAWQAQFNPPPPVAQQQAVPGGSAVQAPSQIPGATSAPGSTAKPSAQQKDVPGAQSAGTVAPDVVQPAMVAGKSSVIDSAQRITVTTDLLQVELDSLGGDIRKASLLKYPEKLEEPEKPVVLFNDQLPRILIAQSGLVATQGKSVDHYATFKTEQSEYSLSEGSDKIDVKLTWQDPEGLTVNKVYTFHRGSYAVDMSVEVVNATGKDWTGFLYRQLQRNDVDPADQSRFIITFTGGVVSNEINKYEKIDLDEMGEWRPEQQLIKGGWVAMIQHYFAGAWIPNQEEYNNFYTGALDNGRYRIGVSSTERKVAPGSTDTFESKIYIGPKIQDRMAHVAPNLQLTVDFGILTILADPVFWLLDNIHDYVGNWGWSIILVTLIIKLIFYKLSQAAYRSMANMRKFQPKIVQIRERYGNDKQRMSQAMMDLYKKEKINPLGGCLPMLVQIPVFIALYWVLLESVELRQAPFILWIEDLSARDPYYVLPLIMGASMFVQQKLNPAPMDPMQQKILMFLPILFTAFFMVFPAGLVLYWVANNILSIAQQWYITRGIERSST
jgi:YidC/Oxa1 family membrane protein insertase